MQQPQRESKKGIWIIVSLMLILLLACLAVALVNAGPGFTVDGQPARLRLVSAVTNYPFCPPEVPCPISMVLNEDHWVVWIVRDTIGVEIEEPYFRKLIDIRVP